MNQNDRAFLDAIANERIQFHYSAYQEKARPDEDSFFALEDRFQAALEQLGKENSDAVREYLEYLFHTSAATQTMLYKAGMVDGIRLTHLI